MRLVKIPDACQKQPVFWCVARAQLFIILTFFNGGLLCVKNLFI